ADVSHSEMRVGGMIGSHHCWSAFTIAFGFGLLVDLNATDSERLLGGYTVHKPLQQVLSPKVDLMSRISLGVVF
ncbi:MAG: hypothetical protein FWD57_09635, partial [Polyangiaceae bacterium]|nr:hypothetical protein [Polyangiaceae bacterium]